MKKYSVVFVCFLAMFLVTAALHAQHGGFTGPQAFGAQPAGFAGAHGFMGPTMHVNVAQIAQSFPNKATDRKSVV